MWRAKTVGSNHHGKQLWKVATVLFPAVGVLHTPFSLHTKYRCSYFAISSCYLVLFLFLGSAIIEGLSRWGGSGHTGAIIITLLQDDPGASLLATTDFALFSVQAAYNPRQLGIYGLCAVAGELPVPMVLLIGEIGSGFLVTEACSQRNALKMTAVRRIHWLGWRRCLDLDSAN